MHNDFEELRQRSIKNLIGFLNVEIDLGLTFASLAQSYRRSGSTKFFETSKRNALAALEVIDRFKDRLPPHLKTEIEEGRSKLAQAVSAL